MMLTRFAPYVIGVLALVLTHSLAYQRGASHTTSKYELRLQTLRAEAAEHAKELEREAREKEQAAANALAAESMKHAKEARHAQMQIDSLRADLRSARVRLSVPVANCVAGSASGEGPAAAGGSGAEARAELMPETAEALVGIAADGDAAVRQLNAVIDAYNAVLERMNAEGG